MAEVGRLEVVLGLRNELRQQAKEAQQSLQTLEQAAEAAASAIAAIGAGVAFRSLIDATTDAVRAYNELQAAQVGVQTVALRVGESLTEVNRVLQELTSDGLLSMADAATSLKNLLATGFNLEEAKNLIIAFKDAAAFGRQAALSFGEAVRSATEGIKNGNSILVDNAGITKNLSQILEEAGYSAQDLSRATSDAAVRQALYNGILKEAALFQGDAAKLAAQLAGEQARVAAEAERVRAAFGDALAPAVQVLTREAGEWLRALRLWAEINPEVARTLALVAAGLTGAATAAGALLTVVRALTIAKNALLGPLNLLIMGLSAVGAAWATAKLSAEANTVAQQEQAQQTLDLMRQYEALRAIIDDASASTEQKEQAMQRLRDVMQQLINLQPVLKDAFDSEGRLIESQRIKYDELRRAVEEVTRAKLNLRIVEAEERLRQLDEQLKPPPEVEGLRARQQWMREQQAALRERAAVERMRGAPSWVFEQIERDIAAYEQGIANIEQQIQAILNQRGQRRLEAERQLAKAELEAARQALAALDRPLPPEEVLPPRVTFSGGGAGSTRTSTSPRMSAALRNALEDIQDLQALPRTPENLEALLARVRQVLAQFAGELAQFPDQQRGLQRLARQLEEFEIPAAKFDRALKNLLHTATIEEWEEKAPQKLKQGLENIRRQFSDFLSRPENLDIAQALEQRIHQAGKRVTEAAKEQAQRAYREAQQQLENMRALLGKDFTPERELDLRQRLRLRELAAELGAVTGDMSALFAEAGREMQLLAEIQEREYQTRLDRIERDRQQRMASLAEEAAQLQKDIITAEQEVQRLQATGVDTAAAEQRVYELRQRLAQLFVPVLEQQRDALQQMLQDTTLTAEQRQEVEQRLQRVLEELRQADLESHRLTEEAKTAATRREAEARAEAERRALEQMRQAEQAYLHALRSVRDALRKAQQEDLDLLRERHEAEERAQERRIQRLREELRQLEQRNREEERALRLQELREALRRAEEAGPLEQFITAEGQVIWRNPEAERLREEIAEEERRQEFERERERLQRQIEAAEQRLQAMREAHRREYEERQAAWQAILDLDDERLGELVALTEQHMGEEGWYGSLSHWLSEAVKVAQAKTNSIVAELSRIVAEAQEAKRALDSLRMAGGGSGSSQPASASTGSGGGIRLIGEGPVPFGRGGLVTHPTLALLAERGVPEYVVPQDYLSDLAGRLARLMPAVTAPSAVMGAGMTVSVNQLVLNLPNVTNADEFSQQLPGALQRAAIDVAAVERGMRLEMRTR